MKWMDKLEKHFGHLAIPGIVRYILLIQAAFFFLILAMPELQSQLVLDPAAVLQGELWRLITYVFIPPGAYSGGWIVFVIIYFLFFLSVGDNIEAHWGTFKLNLYLLCGMIFMTIVAFFIVRGQITNGYLMLSLFLAYATLFPEKTIYIFFVIPVKLKWIGIITAAFLVFEMIFGTFAQKAAILISLGNYFVFFGPTLVQLYQSIRIQSAQKERLTQFRTSSSKDENGSFHQCAVCGRTDLSDPALEFRISGKDGQEYCNEHIHLAPLKSSPSGEEA